MFPIWDIPPWVAFWGAFQPYFNGLGATVIWFLAVVAIIVQIGVVLFGAMTINEAIQKSE